MSTIPFNCGNKDPDANGIKEYMKKTAFKNLNNENMSGYKVGLNVDWTARDTNKFGLSV